jgi:tetratricopeptide (TPR) repeat protein
VDAVVEGAVMWVGGRVRISAQLIEVPTDHHLWAGSYERDLRDVLSMQEEVTRAIVSEIRVKLTAQEQARLANRHPINPEAYKLYLKGRYHWNKRSLEGFQKAIEYFQLAVAKDPAYALAYVGLADTYTYFSFFDVVPPREAMPKAKAAAARALEIDNRLGEAHVSLGYISYMYDWDWPAAGKHFEQALMLNPAYSRAHTFYPFYLSSLGRSEEALAVAKHSLDLDPASPAVSHSLAVQLYLARQFDNAIAQAHKTLELDPNFAISYELLGEVYVSRGMYRESLPELEKYSALSRGRAMSLALLGYAHARLGERSQALRVLRQLRSRVIHLPFLSLLSMPGSARRIKPSRGSKRLTGSAPVASATLKWNHSGTRCELTRVSPTWCAASGSHRKDRSAKTTRFSTESKKNHRPA